GIGAEDDRLVVDDVVDRVDLRGTVDQDADPTDTAQPKQAPALLGPQELHPDTSLAGHPRSPPCRRELRGLPSLVVRADAPTGDRPGVNPDPVTLLAAGPGVHTEVAQRQHPGGAIEGRHLLGPAVDDNAPP